MTAPLTVRSRPCRSCPYRRDVPSGVWEPGEYAKLAQFDGTTADQAAAGAFAVFDCHQRTGQLCAGWVGCHDMDEALALRMVGREVDPAVYGYESPVPLFPSGAEAAAHGMRDVARPGPAARRMIDSLNRLRATVLGRGEEW